MITITGTMDFDPRTNIPSKVSTVSRLLPTLHYDSFTDLIEQDYKIYGGNQYTIIVRSFNHISISMGCEAF